MADRIINLGKYVIDLEQVQCVYELIGEGESATYNVEFRNGRGLTLWNKLPHPTSDPYEVPRKWFIDKWMAYGNNAV